MVGVYGYFNADQLALVDAFHLEGIGIVADLFILLQKLPGEFQDEPREGFAFAVYSVELVPGNP